MYDNHMADGADAENDRQEDEALAQDSIRDAAYDELRQDALRLLSGEVTSIFVPGYVESWNALDLLNQDFPGHVVNNSLGHLLHTIRRPVSEVDHASFVNQVARAFALEYMNDLVKEWEKS